MGPIEELSKKNYIQGKQILESILKKDPKHAVALYNLVVCLSEIGLLQGCFRTWGDISKPPRF